MLLANWLKVWRRQEKSLGWGGGQSGAGRVGQRRRKSGRKTGQLEVFEPRILLTSPPTGVDDSYSATVDQTLNVAASGVLANDSDPDGDPLTASLSMPPVNGSVTLNSDGSFAYTPNSGFTGQDSFSYQPFDGMYTGNNATVTIDVSAGGGGGGGSAPTGAADSYSATADQTLNVSAPGVLMNDTDPDGDSLTAVLGQNPQNGSLTLNADGSFGYTPNTGFTGQDSFTYQPNDGTHSGAATTVTLDVGSGGGGGQNDPAAAPDTYTAEWTSLSVAAPGILSNDTDPNSLPLTAVMDTNVSSGTLTFNSDGSFDYTPNAGFVGTDSFTYHVTNGTETSMTETVTLNVVEHFGTRLNDDILPQRQMTSAAGIGFDAQTGDSGITQAIGGGLGLSYRTFGDGAVVIAVSTEFQSGPAAPQEVETRLTVGGVAGSTIIYSGTTLNAGDEVLLETQFDGSLLGTGHHDWELEVIARSGNNERSKTYTGEVDIVVADAPYGENWSVTGDTRLHAQTGGVLLATSGGAAAWFAENAGSLISPTGALSTSTLVQNGDNTYTLTSKHGSRREFDQNGILTSRVDLNGNTVTYSRVDADSDGQTDDLSVVTDAFGRTLTFAYTSGLLASVTDHAGRVTTVSHDANGKLTSVTAPDPDGAGPLAAAVTSYAWDTSGRPATRTDALGNVTTPQYDFAGLLTGVTDVLGNARQLSAMQGSALVDLSSGTGTSGNPATLTIPTASMESFMIDALGNENSYETDRFGNVTQHTNPLGFTVTYQRDADGRVTQVTQPDPDGGGPLAVPVTTTTYDASGNVLSVTQPGGATQTWTYDATLNLPLTVTDALGRTTTMAYDALGNLLTQTDALGNVATFTYDSHGQVTSSTLPDPDGAGPGVAPVTSYTYDSLGRLTQVTDPDSTTQQFTYDSADNLISQTDELGRSTTFTYDSLGRQLTAALPDPDGTGPLPAPVVTTVYNALGQVISQTAPGGGTTSYTYDGTGNVLSITYPDPDGAGPQAAPVATRSYDAAGRLYIDTDVLGNPTVYTYNGAGWTVASLTMPDPDGTMGPQLAPIISYTHDSLGRQTGVTDPLGRTTTTTYNAAGQVASTTDPLGNTSTATYDAVGNLLTATDAIGNVTSFAYDNLNRRTSVTLPDPDRAGPLSSPTTSTAYDSLGRVTSTTDLAGETTSYSYDVRSRLLSVTDPLSNTSSFTYDAVGNRLTTTDPLGNVTTSVFDDLNRPVSVTDANSGVTTVAFNAAGRMETLTDPVGNTTSWQYDDLGRATSETNALNDARQFEYDLGGNINRRTDRNGRIIEYSYDNLQRRTEELWLDTDGVTVLNTITTVYDSATQLTSISDDVSAFAYTYDIGGRVTQTDNAGTTGLPNIVLTHGYDALGRRTSSSASVDSTADYSNSWTYDGLSRATQLQQTNGGGNTVADKRVDLTYNDRGQFATITRYEDLSGMSEVVTSTYSYDARGRLTGLDHAQWGSSLADYTWTYDAAGRLTQATSVDGTSNYSYDATSQLTAATHSFQTNETYSYDANGNRTLTGYQTGTNNQLLNDGTHTYEYDAEGNRTAKETTATGERVEYAWDHHNRLTGITYRDGVGTITKTVVYTYDVWDRRILKEVDDNGDGSIDRSETFLYDEAHPSQHANGNLTDIVLIYSDPDGAGSQPAALSSRLLHGPAVDQVFADEQTNGELYWLLTDHQGTVRDIADYDAMMMQTTVANHRTFNSFGNVTSESDPTTTTLYGYTSRETDTDANLTYYRARWYDSNSGQFISEDPIGFLAGDPNITRYVSNSPVTSVDPSGLLVEGLRMSEEEILYAIATTHTPLGNIMDAVSEWSSSTLEAVLGVAHNVTNHVYDWTLEAGNYVVDTVFDVGNTVFHGDWGFTISVGVSAEVLATFAFLEVDLQIINISVSPDSGIAANTTIDVGGAQFHEPSGAGLGWGVGPELTLTNAHHIDDLSRFDELTIHRPTDGMSDPRIPTELSFLHENGPGPDHWQGVEVGWGLGNAIGGYYVTGGSAELYEWFEFPWPF